MTRTVGGALLTHYRSGATTMAWGILITRTDDQSFGWTSHDADATLGGFTYRSEPGLDVSAIVSQEGLAVDNAELTVLEYDDVIVREDVLAGIWDNAEFEVFRYNWVDTSMGRDIRKKGKLGNLRPKRGRSVVEVRDLRQAIQSPHQTVLQPTCRYKLGDAKCTKVVSGAPFTVTGTIDISASQYSVTDAARVEAADYFGEGRFTFTSGLNSGLSQKIKTFSAGVFVFWQQFIFPIGTDTYTVTAGCRLRFQQDCITKFSNGINFGGEPNKLNPDTLAAPAP